MKRVFKLIAFLCLLAALLTMGACKSEPVITGRAMIGGDANGFTLENAKGEIYRCIDGHENTMPVYDEVYAPGVPADVTLITDASEYFIYRDNGKGAMYVSISTISTDLYRYYIHGEGPITIKAGVNGVHIQGAPGEYDLSFRLNDLGVMLEIICTGEEITLKQEGAKVYISGVGDTLTLDYRDSKHRDAQTVTISGGSATIDYSLVEKSNKILVTDATGEEKGYYMTCMHG